MVENGTQCEHHEQLSYPIQRNAFRILPKHYILYVLVFDNKGVNDELAHLFVECRLMNDNCTKLAVSSSFMASSTRLHLRCDGLDDVK